VTGCRIATHNQNARVVVHRVVYRCMGYKDVSSLVHASSSSFGTDTTCVREVLQASFRVGTVEAQATQRNSSHLARLRKVARTGEAGNRGAARPSPRLWPLNINYIIS
jgi:hypothetical protein